MAQVFVHVTVERNEKVSRMPGPDFWSFIIQQNRFFLATPTLISGFSSNRWAACFSAQIFEIILAILCIWFPFINVIVSIDRYFPHIFLTFSSHFPHTFLTFSSQSPHNLLTFSSHSPPTFLTISSHFPHNLLTLSSHSPQNLLKISSHYPQPTMVPNWIRNRTQNYLKAYAKAITASLTNCNWSSKAVLFLSSSSLDVHCVLYFLLYGVSELFG